MKHKLNQECEKNRIILNNFIIASGASFQQSLTFVVLLILWWSERLLSTVLTL